MPRLADSMGAIDRLRLDRRVPPRVQQEDVLGGGEVQSESASLQADEKEPAFRIVLKALDFRLTIARPAVEVLVHDLTLVEARAQDRQQARELREHDRLVALVDRLGEARDQHIQLRGRIVGPPAIDQTRMAGCRPQPQQRLEDDQLGSADTVRARPSQQRVPIVRAQFVVEDALRPFQLAVQRLLGLRRQIRRDLLLGPAQDERAQPACELRERVVAEALARRRS